MNSPFRTVAVLLLLGLMAPMAHAQDFLGVVNSNQAGIYGIDLQPAHAADSRYKLHVNLAGAHFDFANNYISARRQDLFNGFRNVNDNTPEEQYLPEIPGTQAKDVFMRLNAYTPGVFVGFGDGGGIAITTRVRSVTTAQGLDHSLARQLYTDREDTALWFTNINDAKFNFQTLNFFEAGLTFGQPVMNTGAHFLKVGGRVKFMMGLFAAYAYVRDLNYQFEEFSGSADADTIRVRAGGDFDYGYSANLPVGETADNWEPDFTSMPTIGGDVGVVYEWRPQWQNYRYNMDGETNLTRIDQNQYKLRLGVSLLDIGRLRFKQGAFSRSMIVDVDTTFNVNDFDFNEPDSLNATMDRYSRSRELHDDFMVALPMRLSFQVDYNIWKDFYINATTLTTFRLGERGTRELAMYSLTPRWDHKWFTVGVPLSVNGFGQFNAGIGFRAGPVIFGSNSGLSNVMRKNISGADVYVAFSVPIFHPRPKDRDLDEVSDRMDECIDVPGQWTFRGCPDTDGDGIQDRDDQCPQIAGIERFHGCPDTDSDGIEDRVDDCPNEAGLTQFRGCPDRDGDGIKDGDDQCVDTPGLAQFNGCPDTDSDGVEDRRDSCVTVAGLAQFSGCPDTDGDGIPDPKDTCPTISGLAIHAGCPDTDGDGLPDREDECPTKPGPRNFQGCPDTDGDGLPDHQDHCPLQAGPRDNNGCPLADTDHDGIPDRDDQCPTEPGPRDNNGCPKIEQDTLMQEAVRTAFENLEFETGKAIIQNSSFASLLELVNVLKLRPNYRINITGHTDNIGDAASNQRLSLARAQAVLKFLTDNGITEDRILAVGMGSTRPVASNATEEGRAKNRRVELEILMEPNGR